MGKTPVSSLNDRNDVQLIISLDDYKFFATRKEVECTFYHKEQIVLFVGTLTILSNF